MTLNMYSGRRRVKLRTRKGAPDDAMRNGERIFRSYGSYGGAQSLTERIEEAEGSG